MSVTVTVMCITAPSNTSTSYHYMTCVYLPPVTPPRSGVIAGSQIRFLYRREDRLLAVCLGDAIHPPPKPPEHPPSAQKTSSRSDTSRATRLWLIQGHRDHSSTHRRKGGPTLRFPGLRIPMMLIYTISKLPKCQTPTTPLPLSRSFPSVLLNSCMYVCISI